ncbi:flagellar hook-basal body complex protein FliE [Cobetia sp. 5-11-6-3]|uniref:flagellar hook-basal body complex protein FliE n=1 Tax=Cobetia sp. 5-11-6-3 TaxID=2737458 RepID=UPI0021001DCD|nr:flagellar hook-basal body complex protein FliE [Cobetia sp. 5-11-6-3]
MAIEAVGAAMSSAMTGSLQQLDQMAAQAAGSNAQSAGAVSEASATDAQGFAGMLKDSLARVSQSQQVAAGQARAFELGSPDVSLDQVMVAGQKASLEFEMTVQVRNKLLSAYKEIMNMAV